mmetsp:Transcript_1521/g.3967  ORF Transcript_1521/g.3967 Transcript_1521/m.3967 type:complete len:298 (-) Transcript_1521:738-1631(-)
MSYHKKVFPFLILGSSWFGSTTMMLHGRTALWSMPLLAGALRGRSAIPVASAFVVTPGQLSQRSQRQLQQQQQRQHQLLPQQQQRGISHGPFVPSGSVSLSASGGDDDEGYANGSNEIVPTWTYVPYDPKKNPQTKHPRNNNKSNKSNNNRSSNGGGTWTVPKHVRIPEDKLEFSFVRSSGSGGQNVNKVSTKVELRLDLTQRQSWMPAEVQDRFRQQQSHRLSKEGILSLASQEHRTQGRNKTEAVNKLRAMVLQAWPRPKIRKQRKGISRAAKARNKDFKKRRSETKQNRKRVDW